MKAIDHQFRTGQVVIYGRDGVYSRGALKNYRRVVQFDRTSGVLCLRTKKHKIEFVDLDDRFTVSLAPEGRFIVLNIPRGSQ